MTTEKDDDTFGSLKNPLSLKHISAFTNTSRTTIVTYWERFVDIRILLIHLYNMISYLKSVGRNIFHLIMTDNL